MNSCCDIILSHLLQPEDANPAGNIHGGVIMKQIDSAAGVVAMRYARCNAVTASIDRLDFHNPAFVGDLLTLRARLNWVGSSSMEIEVHADTENMLTGAIRHTATAYLTFVALDASGRPTAVPPLKVTTAAEKKRYDQALARHQARMAQKRRYQADRIDFDAQADCRCQNRTVT